MLLTAGQWAAFGLGVTTVPSAFANVVLILIGLIAFLVVIFGLEQERAALAQQLSSRESTRAFKNMLGSAIMAMPKNTADTNALMPWATRVVVLISAGLSAGDAIDFLGTADKRMYLQDLIRRVDALPVNPKLHAGPWDGPEVAEFAELKVTD